MGRFFNQEIMNLKRIPGSKVMEQMRKDYNQEGSSSTTEPPRRKRRVRDENGKLVRR